MSSTLSSWGLTDADDKMITVRLPSTFGPDVPDTLLVDEAVATIADLVDAIERRIPGLRAQLSDSVFNFAVNDELLLQRAQAHPLADGDIVELVPAISGGSLD